MFEKKLSVSLVVIALILVSCSKSDHTPLNKEAVRAEEVQENLAKQVAALSPDMKSEQSFIQAETRSAMGPMARAGLIHKAREKRESSSLFRTNEAIVKAMGNHSKIYPFKGSYKVMVIPVQFADEKFVNPDFFKAGYNGEVPAQDYIFGENKESMTSYYKHVSLGNLELGGVVTPIVTVGNNLAAYGEAVQGRSDQNARGLVVDALKELKKIKTDDNWWLNFDNWDLSDYDKDKNFNEPDGFIDAVVLIYAGKSQASCQRSFDIDRERPASGDVPVGPRQAATVECFNRIWPHRWSISIDPEADDFSPKGPIVEGKQRPAMNGLKITDQLFALDYNMQSEFSDRSTFIHEFGHSLSLPDVYSGGKGNSSGSWEIMSSNAPLQAQEMSSYSRISLGWLSPKIIMQGEQTSAYLGNYSFVSEDEREGSILDFLSGDDESLLSITPQFGENVYRSIMVITEPTDELKKVVDLPAKYGNVSAYSSRFNASSKVLSFSFSVPKEGDANVSFDTIYHIETETNFDSKDEKIKIVTDYDIGQVSVNDKVLEKLRIVSGDSDYNTLAEANPACKEADVLALRAKVIKETATDEEKETYKKEKEICQKPIWITKTYDMSEYRGEDITFSIDYITDAGYTEFGIVVDNVKLPGQDLITFEDEKQLGDFEKLENGQKTLTYNQFYLFEYRNPGEKYSDDHGHDHYNMDNNISTSSQSMFLGEGTTADRFRMVTYDYQPGVLVWYFNSKYDRGPTGNNPEANEGKGYLLVVNANLGELRIPGVFDNEAFLNENGVYPKVELKDGEEDNVLEEFVRKQRDEFICFSHTEYSTYLEGVAPECASEEFKDFMQTLTFEGKSLLYRRERFNETLPIARYATAGVGVPFRTGAATRTGLSTFRSAGSEDFKPFKIYKTVDGEMVLDQKMTDDAVTVKAVSKFQDKDNAKPFVDKALHGDSAVVEVKGFSFEVTSPSSRILKSYDGESADGNNYSHRKPRAKVYFNWQ